MAHLNRSRLVRTSTRRKTGWGTGPKSATDGGGADISASGSFIGAIGASPASDGITLVRLRGEFLFYLATSTALNNGYFGAVGVGIFTDAAVAIGVTAVNTPISTEEWDGWLWHRYFSALSAGAISAAGASLSGGQSDDVKAALRVEVDSKAMRKIPVGMTMAVVVQVTEIGSATARWHFNSRTLSKLP